MCEKRNDLEIHRTLPIYIDQRSSSIDVFNWLYAKEFPSDIVKSFAEYSGEQLFALRVETLIQLCGLEEG